MTTCEACGTPHGFHRKLCPLGLAQGDVPPTAAPAALESGRCSTCLGTKPDRPGNVSNEGTRVQLCADPFHAPAAPPPIDRPPLRLLAGEPAPEVRLHPDPCPLCRSGVAHVGIVAVLEPIEGSPDAVRYRSLRVVGFRPRLTKGGRPFELTVWNDTDPSVAIAVEDHVRALLADAWHDGRESVLPRHPEDGPTATPAHLRRPGPLRFDVDVKPGRAQPAREVDPSWWRGFLRRLLRSS